MEYNFKTIELYWQNYWQQNKTFKVSHQSDKPKYYVLDMFPYPSGAGLHVGHPLGYIASDIYSRYKRLTGHNVLHPMGYDAFGLPAEQYAIQTGQHPAVTTENNITRYRSQLQKIGFSYDWDRELRTSDPGYYKWTQWAFMKMFTHWYNKKTNKAESIETLIEEFEINGNQHVNAVCSQVPRFYAEVWRGMNDIEREQILMNYRLAYRAVTMVNWCPALGTVLANDEVKDGRSVRGDHEVEQKPMMQWLLRISAYAERLLTGLDNLEWSESLKEMQRNWIGKSEGAEVYFKVDNSDISLKVFTTRPDTIFGATFMVLAPENDVVQKITTPELQLSVQHYISETKKRTERERLADTKTVSGQFTGAYAVNPFTNALIPIWISDYVLAGYGTGAIMAVPAHDSRDFAFARHFNLPVVQVVEGADITQESYDDKNGKMMNSGFLNGMDVKEAVTHITQKLDETGIGSGKINYRIRDAIFSRQRYWGEPFPVYYKNGQAYLVDDEDLPIELPPIDSYLPTSKGEPPLGNARNWVSKRGYPLELSTMPGFAGSSAYYLRYMDPHNNEALVSENANQYWRNVDLYIGGTEHAVGHLIYSRFWNKFLFDLGFVCENEPFKKLINQGMIQGRSNFVYRIKNTNIYVSHNLRDQYEVTRLHVDVNIVKNDILDLDKFKAWRAENHNAQFILEDDKYICGWAVEKMSKSLYNVVNPDDIIDQYGADTLRMYEMFLGPIEQSKPWDTNGIEGVSKFLKKYWRLFTDLDNNFKVSTEPGTDAELKILHKTIKKVSDDIEKFSFNTSVSAFMICVNELGSLKCNKKEILEPLTVLLSPFAPHITEEIWKTLGNETSISEAQMPAAIEKYYTDNVITYPVAVNGKTKFTIDIDASFNQQQIIHFLEANPKLNAALDGKTIAKVIVVPQRMINYVVK